jgi:hypothetical protein
MNRITSQKGNVLFVVLAAIALFAGLVMAITRSDNTDSSAVLSQAEAKLHAASIMRFGSDVEQAVHRLTTIGGCDIEEVSFERAPFDGSDTDYVNPNSPTNKSCHVFHGNGGQVEYITFEDKWKDENFSDIDIYGDWFFSFFCLGSGGSPNCNSEAEAERRASLAVIAPMIKLEICKNLNSSLISEDRALVDSFSLFRTTLPYKGDFYFNVPHLNINPAADVKYNIQQSLCVQTESAPASNSYNYFNIVYLREDKFNE